MVCKKRKQEPAVCWCCGGRCPDGSRTDRAGWHSREITIASMPMVEVYCPGCFEEWGWPAPMEQRLREGA